MGIERLTFERDAYAMDATNGYHVRTLWHLLVVLVLKHSCALQVGSMDEHPTERDPPIPEPCRWRCAIAAYPCAKHSGALPSPMWKKTLFHMIAVASIVWAPYVRPCSRAPSASVSCGLTTPGNIVPACMKCNQRKATMTAHEFFATTKRAQRTKTPTEHQLALGDGGQRGVGWLISLDRLLYLLCAKF